MRLQGCRYANIITSGLNLSSTNFTGFIRLFSIKIPFFFSLLFEAHYKGRHPHILIPKALKVLSPLLLLNSNYFHVQPGIKLIKQTNKQTTLVYMLHVYIIASSLISSRLPPRFPIWPQCPPPTVASLAALCNGSSSLLYVIYKFYLFWHNYYMSSGVNVGF